MNKNKALIYLRTFNIGGAEKSNLHMMKRLNADGWDVELVLQTSGGTMENQIPKDIKVTYLDGGLSKTAQYDATRLTYTKSLLKRLVQRISMRRFKGKKYDIAINGLQTDAVLLSEYIIAEVRLQWIRIDLDAIKSYGRSIGKLMRYSDYIDGYICISQSVYESFITNFPSLKDKAFIVYNFFDQEEMSEKLKEKYDPFVKYDPSIIKVVTVCRIHDRQKGVFRMLEVYKRLRDDGINFYWFVIGDGPDLEELILRSDDFGLSEGFICLGSTSNPFPYYCHADLCATLSYYEGFGRTVSEAKLMGKAVIATEFAGIQDQIQHLENGYIVGNNEDSIYDGMKLLLSDRQLLHTLANDYLPSTVSDENTKAEQLYNIIDSLRVQKFQQATPDQSRFFRQS